MHLIERRHPELPYCEHPQQCEVQPGVCGWCLTLQRALSSESALAAAEARAAAYREDLRRAVNAACTCGGGEPGNCCPACEVWHAVGGLMAAVGDLTRRRT
jgi:hypothetical protein